MIDVLEVGVSAIRVIGRFLFELIIETLLQGALHWLGYLLVLPFRRDVDVEDGICFWVGLLAGVAIIVGVVLVVLA